MESPTQRPAEPFGCTEAWPAATGLFGGYCTPISSPAAPKASTCLVGRAVAPQNACLQDHRLLRRLGQLYSPPSCPLH